MAIGFHTQSGLRRGEVSLFRRIVGLLILGVVSVLAVGFAVGTRRSFQVISRSMEPTLRVGDCVLMTKARPGEDLRGKIIAFRPGDGGSALTKRIIACGGDRVDLVRGRLLVNGQAESYSQETIMSGDRSWKLAENEYFVVGDNRNNSNDSIDHGPIRREDVLGVLVYRYWPPGRRGAIP